MTPLPPGSTIGILGGGQLGRMLAVAAAQIGYKTHVFAPDADSVAAPSSLKMCRLIPSAIWRAMCPSVRARAA